MSLLIEQKQSFFFIENVYSDNNNKSPLDEI